MAAVWHLPDDDQAARYPPLRAVQTDRPLSPYGACAPTFPPACTHTLAFLGMTLHLRSPSSIPATLRILCAPSEIRRI